MIAAPAATASRERREWGVRNLGRGLLPEASKDFEDAVVLFPYDGVSHFGLGLVHLTTREPARAGESFDRAFRYGLGEVDSVAADAALLAARAWQQAEAPDNAARSLQAGVEAFPEDPALRFAHARLTGNERDLQFALELAPEFVSDALALELPHVDAAAESAAAKVDSEVDELSDHQQRVTDAAREAGVAVPPCELPSDTDIRGAARLLLALRRREVLREWINARAADPPPSLPPAPAGGSRSVGDPPAKPKLFGRGLVVGAWLAIPAYFGGCLSYTMTEEGQSGSASLGTAAARSFGALLAAIAIGMLVDLIMRGSRLAQFREQQANYNRRASQAQEEAARAREEEQRRASKAQRLNDLRDVMARAKQAADRRRLPRRSHVLSPGPEP